MGEVDSWPIAVPCFVPRFVFELDFLPLFILLKWTVCYCYCCYRSFCWCCRWLFRAEIAAAAGRFIREDCDFTDLRPFEACKG